MRALNQIFDLPSIHLYPRQSVQPLLRKLLELPPSRAINKVLPHLPPRRGRQVRIRQEQIDARLKRMVEAPDAVRRQEAHALVVLELRQEHGDELVARDVGIRARGQEDVRLVEQQHRAPQAAELQRALERRLDRRGRGAEGRGADGVEGHAGALGHGFCGEGLAGAWGPEHQDDDASTFERDEVVEGVGGELLVRDELPGEVFFVAWEDETVEGGVVPGDWGEVGDVEEG